MAQSKAHVKASAKYNQKAYKDFRVWAKKDFGDEVAQHISFRNESANSFFNRAAVTQMAVDNGEITAELPTINETAQAWKDFFNDINESNEEVPEFERVKFCREVIL